jgi:SAM-dependent methyltransferase
MTPFRGNRFDDFFAHGTYVALKNLLYSYLLRKRAIGKYIRDCQEDLILEVGSGLSPMVTDSNHVVYSELSFPALQILQQHQKKGVFVAADAAHLPFKAGSFEQVVCSEVVEHLPEDRAALREISAVVKTGGSLILTFPHRRNYFANDDRFVGHFRRYELKEIEERLREAGLNPVETRNVLGPLEKMTMVFVVSLISLQQSFRKAGKYPAGSAVRWKIIAFLFKWFNRLYCVPMWIDAWLSPRFLAAVLLIRAVKR